MEFVRANVAGFRRPWKQPRISNLRRLQCTQLSRHRIRPLRDAARSETHDVISRPGELNVQMAYASCVLLMIVTVAAVALIERVRVGTEALGEF